MHKYTIREHKNGDTVLYNYQCTCGMRGQLTVDRDTALRRAEQHIEYPTRKNGEQQ